MITVIIDYSIMAHDYSSNEPLQLSQAPLNQRSSCEYNMEFAFRCLSVELSSEYYFPHTLLL